jgi:hypothetical protein
LEEEAAKKEIAKLENRANRLEKELKDGPGAERTWYQNKTAAPKKKANPAEAKPKMSNKKQVKKSFYRQFPN